MPTSRTSGLSEPIGDEEISVGTLAYFRSRFKRRLYDRMLEAFENSGITQTTLARRLGLGTDRVCRVLGGPGNLTLDTVSDFMFASGGAEFDLSVAYPLRKLSTAAPAEEKQPEYDQPLPSHGMWKLAIFDTGLNPVSANNQSLLTRGDASWQWLGVIADHRAGAELNAEKQIKKRLVAA